MATTYDKGSYDAPVVYKNKSLSGTVVGVRLQPTELTGWRITNPNSTTVVVKFFDAASVSDVTLGTTEPCKEFSIPSQGEIHVAHLRGSSLFYFSLGCCLVAVRGLETSNTSAPILAVDCEIYFKKV